MLGRGRAGHQPTGGSRTFHHTQKPNPCILYTQKKKSRWSFFPYLNFMCLRRDSMSCSAAARSALPSLENAVDIRVAPRRRLPAHGLSLSNVEIFHDVHPRLPLAWTCETLLQIKRMWACCLITIFNGGRSTSFHPGGAAGLAFARVLGLADAYVPRWTYS